MSVLMNFNEPKDKPIRVNEWGEKLIRDIECATCKKMYECKGKPIGVKNCINYVERKSDHL